MYLRSHFVCLTAFLMVIIILPGIVLGQGEKWFSIMQVESLIQQKGISEERVFKLLLENGIDFYLDDNASARLVRVGATDRMIEVLRKAKYPSERLLVSLSPRGVFKPVKGYFGSDFWSGTKGSIGTTMGLSIEYRHNSFLSFLFDVEHIDGEYWDNVKSLGVGNYDIWIYAPIAGFTVRSAPRNASISIFPRLCVSIGGGLYEASYYRRGDVDRIWKTYGVNAGIGMTLVKMIFGERFGLTLETSIKYHHFGKSLEHQIKQGASLTGALGCAFWR